MKSVDWSYVPRAKLAATINFSMDNPERPNLPKLIKYLMDILCNVICKDDKQFHYIAASCTRPNRIKKATIKESIYIEVERLTDIKQKFSLYKKLCMNNGFQNYLTTQQDFECVYERKIEKLWPDRATAQVMNIPNSVVEEWHKIAKQENQQKLLLINKLDESCSPDGPKSLFYQEKEQWYEMNPFKFYMEGFPTKGGLPKYKARLREKLKELNLKFPQFGKIILPFELDVQVSPKNGILRTDLDNIMLRIDDVFSDELLEDDSYLHGYRIYVIREAKTPQVNSLRFKLLSLYQIYDFQNYIDKILKIGIEWLESREYYW